MTMDRRQFAGSMLLGAGVVVAGFPGTEALATPAPGMRAMLMVDAGSGRVLHRSGGCTQRFSPCSTFKIPLGLMGFDAGILQDAHHPAWAYRPEVHEAVRAIDKQRTDPTTWEANSVIWFSREITGQLGAAKFKAYVDRFAYGNRDVRGNPGKQDGLTHSWLGSSLAISPDEQVAFVRRLLAGGLVSPRAHAMTRAILPMFDGSGGWRVHGKTGSGTLRGQAAGDMPMGWFVGWADKGRRRVAFARFGAGADVPGAGGLAMRRELLAAIGKLAG